MDAIRAVQLLGEKADTEWTLGDLPGARTFASKVINQDTTDTGGHSATVAVPASAFDASLVR